MQRRTVILGLIVTSCAPSTRWTLIAVEEAAPAQAASRPSVAPASAAPLPPSPGAPIIEVLQPDETKPVTPPVTIRLRFVPQGNSTIDVASFRATYDGWFTIDITNRILQHAQISESGLIAENAEIPPGHYTVTLRIADNFHRLGTRTFDFAIV